MNHQKWPLFTSKQNNQQKHITCNISRSKRTYLVSLDSRLYTQPYHVRQLRRPRDSRQVLSLHIYDICLISSTLKHSHKHTDPHTHLNTDTRTKIHTHIYINTHREIHAHTLKNKQTRTQTNKKHTITHVRIKISNID